MLLLDQKSLLSGKMAPLVAIIFAWLRSRLVSDEEIVASVALLVMFDTLTGLVRYWRAGQFSSRGVGKLFTKVGVYAVMMMLASLVNQIAKTHPGFVDFALSWFGGGLYAFIVGREALSILENLATIEPTLAPRWILRRLAQFNEDGQPGSDITSNPNPQN